MIRGAPGFYPKPPAHHRARGAISGVSGWELLYTEDMVTIAGSLEELLVKVQTWKSGMEKKGLRVNMGKDRCSMSGHSMAE